MADGITSTMVSSRFRDYKVIAKTTESDVITSFTLAPADGLPVPAYHPGQYLVFRLTVNGKPILRNYSVSSDPADTRVLRIAVKREPAPKDSGWQAGLGSNHLHDHIQVGNVLTAAGPMGKFVLAEDSGRPVVLLSGGVGLTPMMCMLHRLVKSSLRPVFFIHACENGKVHAFADEVQALASLREGVSVHFCYRSPDHADLDGKAFHSQGLITRQQLQALLPLDDYDFYLCGPAGFMQGNWRLLRSLGVARQRIHYEFFGPATVLEEEDPVDAAAVDNNSSIQAVVRDVAAVRTEGLVGWAEQGVEGLVVPVAPPMQVPAPANATQTQVSFMPSGTTMAWNDECLSLLELAEQAGLDPDFNCRAGLCNTCMSTLVSGQVDYFEPPLDEPPAGRVLLCCSRPVGPVVIKLGT